MINLQHRTRRGAADALNRLANQVAALSTPEVPMVTGELRASAIFPDNDVDGSHTANVDHLVAMVSYNKVYAAAQHEGEMTYERGGNLVVWIVKRHTEPGTKRKYLEDPFKAMVPRMEAVVAASVRKAIEGR